MDNPVPTTLQMEWEFFRTTFVIVKQSGNMRFNGQHISCVAEYCCYTQQQIKMCELFKGYSQSFIQWVDRNRLFNETDNQIY